MSRPCDEDVLLNCVPEAGDPIGNVTVIRQLGWDEEKYWRVRDHLLDAGTLIRGRGKGGSIRRSLAEPEEALPHVAKPTRASTAEGALYEPLLKVLRDEWTREMRIEPDEIYFEETAWLGKKKTGGTWTRPDITGVSVRSFPHLPNKYLDIWTFEVKKVDEFDVIAIFEAASHAGRATRSYALVQIPDGDAQLQELLDRCEREAARLRVGLITFVQPSNFASWETRVEAPRIDTDPEFLEDFISQLSDEAKKRLSRWK